jgi:hypothetical protein
LGNFLILNSCAAQIFLDSSTNQVYMPKIVYKAIRAKISIQDSIILNQIKIIAQKDSIIRNDSLEVISYKSELDQKNKTIKDLSNQYTILEKEYTKEKSSILSNFKLWLGLTGGLVFGVLIVN